MKTILGNFLTEKIFCYANGRLDRDCKQIRINHVPQNTVANHLYKSLGFQETGEMEDGEVLLSYHDT